MEKKEKNKDRVGAGTLLLWCGNGASVAVQTVLLGFLQIYCTNALGLSALLVGSILMGSKIIDAFTDLTAGVIVDKTHTRFGKGRPYAFCILGIWLMTWLMFSVPAEYSTVAKCAWIAVAYILSESIFKTFLNASGNVYMVRAFNSEKKYVTLNSIGGFLTTAAVMVFNVVFPRFWGKIVNSAPGWSKLIGYIAIPLAIIGILRFFFIPEKYDVDSDTEPMHFRDIITLFKVNRNFIPLLFMALVVGVFSNMSVASYYYLYIVKNVEISGVMSLFGMVPMLSLLFYPLILRKISVKKLVQVSMLFSLISAPILFIAKDNLVLLAIGGIISGLVSLPASYMQSLLIVDCSNYNEWKHVPRMEGTLSCFFGFANKVGSALGTFLIGVLLSAAAFDGKLDVEPDSAIMMIRVCNSFIPMVFSLIAALALCFYTIDKVKPQMMADLEARRNTTYTEAANG